MLGNFNRQSAQTLFRTVTEITSWQCLVAGTSLGSSLDLQLSKAFFSATGPHAQKHVSAAELHFADGVRRRRRH